MRVFNDSSTGERKKGLYRRQRRSSHRRNPRTEYILERKPGEHCKVREIDNLDSETCGFLC